MQIYSFFAYYSYICDAGLTNLTGTRNMEELTSKTFWEDASKGGLALGAVSIAYLLIGKFLDPDMGARIGSLTYSLITIVLWIVKFAGCIWLMKFFLEKFANKYQDSTRDDVFKEGCAIAFLSALIFSAFFYIYATFINPDMFSQAIEQAMSTYSAMLDSNSMEAMESMFEKLPMITAVTNLIYCTIFGMVVSSICSRSLVSDDPFREIE